MGKKLGRKPDLKNKHAGVAQKGTVEERLLATGPGSRVAPRQRQLGV